MNNQLTNGIIFDVDKYMMLVQEEEYMLNNVYSRVNNLNNNLLTLEALDRIKILNTMSDGYMTTQMAADYFEVPVDTIRKLVIRNRQELEMNGLITLRGNELSDYLRQDFVMDIMSITKIRNITLFNRRTVLNVAMLLRDSLVAKAVRYVILNVLDTDEGKLLLEQENNKLKLELLKQQTIINQLQMNQKLDSPHVLESLEILGQDNAIIREKYISALNEIDRLRSYIDSSNSNYEF